MDTKVLSDELYKLECPVLYDDTAIFIQAIQYWKGVRHYRIYQTVIRFASPWNAKKIYRTDVLLKVDYLHWCRAKSSSITYSYIQFMYSSQNVKVKTEIYFRYLHH